MKLENQVCSLELAKKLKELGIKQESLWWWLNYDYPVNFKGDKKATMNFHIVSKQKKGEIEQISSLSNHNRYSAFTVAELGEMLPRGYYTIKSGSDWLCQPQLKQYDMRGDTEANARAKMLIYLLENKLIKKGAR